MVYKYLRGFKKMKCWSRMSKTWIEAIRAEANSNVVFREAKGKQAAGANISRPLGAFCVLMRYIILYNSGVGRKQRCVAFAPVRSLSLSLSHQQAANANANAINSGRRQKQRLNLHFHLSRTSWPNMCDAKSEKWKHEMVMQPCRTQAASRLHTWPLWKCASLRSEPNPKANKWQFSTDANLHDRSRLNQQWKMCNFVLVQQKRAVKFCLSHF